MLRLDEKILNLVRLQTELRKILDDIDFLLYRVESNNPFFTVSYSQRAIENIISDFLDQERLASWLDPYQIKLESGTLGIILAGNIPLVGFHDILCAYFCSSHVRIKLSSKDSILTRRVMESWFDVDREWSQRCQIVEKIEHCDRIIATGSNQSYRYFEFYFKKYKHLLRRNRTSIAILDKDLSDHEVDLLMDDILLYFGLGCRNVTKLYIEKGFDLNRLFEASERYAFLFQHSKYMNNYDYHRTILLLNKIPHLSNNFFMLREEKQLFSPISVVHYEWFEDRAELDFSPELMEDMQCIVSRRDIPFGQSQKPSLSDYADGVDTIQFLMS